jgi:hypothetical protein
VPPDTFLHDCAGQGLGAEHYVERLEAELDRLGTHLLKHGTLPIRGKGVAVDAAIRVLDRQRGLLEARNDEGMSAHLLVTFLDDLDHIDANTKIPAWVTEGAKFCARTLAAERALLRQDGDPVRCGSCGSVAEHTLRGWYCTGSEERKGEWVPVKECSEKRTGERHEQA